MTLSSTHLLCRHAVGFACAILTFCLSMPSMAADDDIYQNQTIRKQSQTAITQQQQAIINAATPETKQKQPISAQNQQLSPEAAIFITINRRDWVLLEELIASYEPLVHADPDMLLFAKAALNASKGKVKSAVKQYQELLTHQPNFVRARLDLARLYYQDGLYHKSQATFAQVNSTPKLPPAVKRNIEAYLTAIDKKQSLNATLALGAGYQHNINESSESNTCLFELPNGDCGYMRSTPKGINSAAANIEATLNRNWQIHNHHGSTINLLGYGTLYHQDTANDYDNSTVNLSAGYRYVDHRQELSLTPLIEHHREDNQHLYTATGARLSYNQNPSQTILGRWLEKPIRASLDVEYKNFSYRDDFSNNDGFQWLVHGNLYMTTNPNTQWFISLDYLDRDNDDKPNAYHQAGIGMGYYKHWQNGFTSTTVLRHRRRKHEAHNALLGTKRKDEQTSLYASVYAPKWQVCGFEPSLSYQYRHNNSNIDWLYDYDTSSVWLKMFKVFQ